MDALLQRHMEETDALLERVEEVKLAVERQMKGKDKMDTKEKAWQLFCIVISHGKMPNLKKEATVKLFGQSCRSIVEWFEKGVEGIPPPPPRR